MLGMNNLALIAIIFVLIGCGKEIASDPTLPAQEAPKIDSKPVEEPKNVTSEPVPSPVLVPVKLAEPEKPKVEPLIVTLRHWRSSYESSSFYGEPSEYEHVNTRQIDPAKRFELQRDYEGCNVQETAGVILYDCRVSVYACKNVLVRPFVYQKQCPEVKYTTSSGWWNPPYAL